MSTTIPGNPTPIPGTGNPPLPNVVSFVVAVELRKDAHDKYDIDNSNATVFDAVDHELISDASNLKNIEFFVNEVILKNAKDKPSTTVGGKSQKKKIQNKNKSKRRGRTLRKK